MRILVVDDRPLGARKLRDDILSAEPEYQVEVASGEGQAADRAKQIVQEARERFDVFLIDDNLGVGLNGSELMAELRQLSPSSEAIIFTANDDEEGKQRAIEAGARAYIRRPVKEKELLWQLHGVQKERSTRRERDWLHLLTRTTERLQQVTSIRDAGQAIVDGVKGLGFQRARLRMVCGGQGEQLDLIGVSQTGNIGLPDDYATTKRSLCDLPYSRKVIVETRKPTMFHARELGEAPWDEFIGAPRDDWFKVPLFVRDTPIGTLSMDNGIEPNQYASDDRQHLEQLLSLFGKQAATALERARLQEQTDTLGEIGSVVTTKAAQGNLDALLEEVRQQVKRLMGVSNFMVVLTDPDTNLLDFRLNYEGDVLIRRQWRDPEQGLVGYLIHQERSPLLLTSAAENAFREQHQIPLCGKMSQCWLGVPLQVDQQRTIGALVVQDYKNPQQYNEEDQRLLEAVAKQIAGAIDLVAQREDEALRFRRATFLNKIKEHLPNLVQDKEDWFWHLLLKFVTDECGLRFNRSVIFLANGDGDLLSGKSGVGQLHWADAHREWEELVKGRRLDIDQQCDLNRFFEYLRDRQFIDHTPIEQQASTWTLSITDEPLLKVREAGQPGVFHHDQLPLPETIRAGFQGNPSAECVAAPLIANGRFLGMVLADNAFNNEPVRKSVLESLCEILNYTASLWDRAETRRRELTPEQRRQFASLQAKVLQDIHHDNLKAGLRLVCTKATEMLPVDSVVIYPLADDGATYWKGQIAQVGLDPKKAKKDFAFRPRQHGSFAYVKRIGEVVVPDVTKSNLRFLDPLGFDQPLEDHGFIRDHGIRGFVGLALRSHNTGDPLGVMYLNTNAPHYFTGQEKMLAKELAEIAVLAISTARGNIEAIDQQRTQELNRLRDVLEAALSPDADETKVRSALFANAMALLPVAKSVGLSLVELKGEQATEGETWMVYRSSRDEPPAAPVWEKIASNRIAARAFQERDFIPDFAQDGETVIAWAAPVYHNKQVVGVLHVTSDPGEGFNGQDKTRVAELASTAGLVIGNLRRRQGLLRAVLEAAKEVTRPSTFQETMQAVVDQACIAAPELECVTLWYLEPGSEKLVVGPFQGVKNPKHQKGDVTESTLVRSIMAEDEAVWAPDVRQHESFKDNEFIDSEGIVSIAAFPLWDEEVSVGALFFNYRKEHNFTSEERDAFPIFAAIAAASIREAQLREATENARNRLAIAARVSAAVGILVDLPTVLERIVDELHNRFTRQGRDSIPYVMLYNPQADALVFAPSSTQYYRIDHPDYQEWTLFPLASDIKSLSLQVACATLEALKCYGKESVEERSVVQCVNDMEAEGFVRFWSETKSELCAGLASGDSFLGVLVLKSSKRDAFTSEDVQLFKLAAEQVALAVDRAERAASARRDATVDGAIAWAADLAHDIESQVGLIRSGAYSLLHLLDPALPEMGKEWVQSIDDSARYLADTSRDALARQDLLSTSQFRLAEFLKDRIADWQTRHCRNVDIEVIEPEPIELRTSQERVWRTTRILLRNAAEAMEHKGRIVVSIHKSEGPVLAVDLRIKDEGPGLSNEARQRVFKELYSEKNEPGRSGHGLGLLIAQWLIKTLKGSIRLFPDNPHDRGAEFLIHLPTLPDSDFDTQEDSHVR